jgi:hypothetical protein
MNPSLTLLQTLPLYHAANSHKLDPNKSVHVQACNVQLHQFNNYAVTQGNATRNAR